MKLELRKVKIQERLSRETMCFSADLYVDGVLAGEVINEGSGGCNMYYWKDRALGKQVQEWAKQQITEFNFEQLDCLLNKLLKQEEIRKQYKRWIKKGTYFRCKGDKIEAWRVVSSPYNTNTKAWIENKYGGTLECIMNENIEKAVALTTPE